MIQTKKMLKFNSEFEVLTNIDATTLDENGDPYISIPSGLYNYVLSNGNGIQTYVEYIVKSIWMNTYSNVKDHQSNADPYDVEVTDQDQQNCRYVDIRTISKKKRSVYLGNTNAYTKRNTIWCQDKVNQLGKNGGYVFIDPYYSKNLSWSAYWFSAEAAVNVFGNKHKDGNIRIAEILELYGK